MKQEKHPETDRIGFGWSIAFMWKNGLINTLNAPNTKCYVQKLNKGAIMLPKFASVFLHKNLQYKLDFCLSQKMY